MFGRARLNVLTEPENEGGMDERKKEESRMKRKKECFQLPQGALQRPQEGCKMKESFSTAAGEQPGLNSPSFKTSAAKRET